MEALPRLRLIRCEGVGYDRIDLDAARRLAPFGCDIAYHTPRRKSPETEAGASWLPLEELAATSDFVSLHCPVTPGTFHLVNDAFLGKMKSTAFWVNTARVAAGERPDRVVNGL